MLIILKLTYLIFIPITKFHIQISKYLLDIDMFACQ